MFSGKNSKGFGAVETLLLIVVAAVIIGAGVYVWQINKDKSLADLLPAIKKSMATDFTNVTVEANGWHSESSVNVPLSAPGQQFKLAPTNASTLYFILGQGKPKTVKHWVFFKRTIPAPGYFDTISNAVEKQLVNNSFQLKQTKDSTEQYFQNVHWNTRQVATKIYTRNQDTCVLSTSKNADSYIDTIPSLSCYSSAQWQQLATQATPFVASYVQAHPKTQADKISFGPLTIKSQHPGGVITASKTKGYDIAEALLLDNGYQSLALFYEKDNAWHFVTGAGDEYGFSCKAMKADPDARKAFYGQVCLGDAGQVRLDSTERALQ